MGATLHFETSQYFQEDLQKAEVYFSKVIRHMDPFNEVGRSSFYNPAIVDLLDCLRIVFNGTIYEIRKTDPRLIQLPKEKQDRITEDIRGLGMRYDYQNPKHYFLYEMKELMLPLDPVSMWNEQGISAEKLSPGIGFYASIQAMRLDAMTKKTLKKASWNMLVVTLSV